MIVSIRDYAKITGKSTRTIYKHIKSGNLKCTIIEYNTSNGVRVAKGIEIDENLYKTYLRKCLIKEQEKYVTYQIPSGIDAETIEKLLSKIIHNESQIRKVFTKKIKVKKQIVDRINDIFATSTTPGLSKIPFWIKILVLDAILNNFNK